MKYSDEQLLLAARPDGRAGNAGFVARTMQAVRAASAQAVTARALGTAKPKRRLFSRLKALPTAALIALALAGVITLGGVAYAAVQLAPTVIKIFRKEISQRGTTVYSVPDFAACKRGGDAYPIAEFELNKDAPRLSDEEVEKILQAKCELKLIDGFVSNTWHTYGTHAKWQDGDDIFYTRPDMLGTLKSVSPTTATIDTGGPNLVNYTAPKGEQIVAYANGQKIPLSQVKPGDAVFTVIRVAETYHTTPPFNGGRPRPQGIIALIVMSLPAQYYGGMQQYLTAITPCMGNPGESCPNTGSIDIFPREGGESAANHAFVRHANAVVREISGSVIKITPNSVTLKAHSGKAYTVTTPANDIAAYNSTYAPGYTDLDATLKIGSTVMVDYAQVPGADPQTITPDQIETVVLQIDSSNPKAGIKQY